jgi:hypothetical protein
MDSLLLAIYGLICRFGLVPCFGRFSDVCGVHCVVYFGVRSYHCLMGDLVFVMAESDWSMF